MRGIVQYEVYVLEGHRWSLHARYPGAQRAEAMFDASATESTTGRATKVVRDTYFPETNENEEITTYVSPKARALQAMAAAARKTVAGPRRGDARKPLVRTAAVHPNRRRPVKMTRVAAGVRIFVAIGMSLIIATSVTAVVSWLLTRMTTMSIGIPANYQAATLTVIYTCLVLYTFPKAFRARLRLHQVLAEMWESTGTSATKPAAPKAHPPRRAGARNGANAFKPWEAPTTDAAAAVTAQAPVAPLLTLEPVPEPPAIAPTYEISSFETPDATPAPPPPPPTPPKLVPPVAAPQPAPVAAETFALERIVLRRFAVDVVVPSLVQTLPDDPVTRRGIALVMAGAVSGLGETATISPDGRTALLSEALRESGSKASSIESFVSNYNTHVNAPAANPLMAAGRNAIVGYTEGKRDIERSLQDAMNLWRYPGTAARMTTTKPDFFVLTEARQTNILEDASESAPGPYDTIVRSVALETGGQLVAHEGPGLFLRYSDAATALSAVEAMRSHLYMAGGGSMAAAIVSAAGMPPAGEPTVIDRARTLLSLAGVDDTLCEPDVQNALPDPSRAQTIEHHTNALKIVEAAKVS